MQKWQKPPQQQTAMSCTHTVTLSRITKSVRTYMGHPVRMTAVPSPTMRTGCSSRKSWPLMNPTSKRNSPLMCTVVWLSTAACSSLPLLHVPLPIRAQLCLKTGSSSP
jgi:hypothetical protein